MDAVHRARGKQQGVWPIDALGLFICAGASVAFYLLTVAPLARQRRVEARQVNELETRREEIAALEISIARGRERLEQIQQESQDRSIHLDAVTEINKRIARLTEFFSAQDLTVDDIQTSTPCPGPDCSVVPVSVVGRGDFVGSARFLHGLGATFPDMSVVRIDLQGAPAPRAPHRFRFDLFWYAAPVVNEPGA
jgi:hypothetical protein